VVATIERTYRGDHTWMASADTPVGYPMVNVRDIESEKVRATRQLLGAD
jgi:hypothetical protein